MRIQFRIENAPLPENSLMLEFIRYLVAKGECGTLACVYVDMLTRLIHVGLLPVHTLN